MVEIIDHITLSQWGVISPYVCWDMCWSAELPNNCLIKNRIYIGKEWEHYQNWKQPLGSNYWCPLGFDRGVVYG